ncbi:MAG: diaminopimelate epimerase [Candidatus Omnitrophica bacterium CG07_land_8_20_14_0_80_42_15]|uniref:Diaminopimelate epimerase n=1 Tax=Candidatus Aquitaenariimonas noxiae TaxID=1974741 RepID=A0A2J0KTQ6_9BACT|nr:MAG: diaminopimelate epimerase [Candidatus Omnitrophica bacterium CG07_land_8_20_14_0_80_42_15]
MKEIKFTKLVASGNDFVLVDSRKNKVAKWSSGQVVKWPDFAKKVCRQKLGVSADGLLVLEDSNKADVKMRIINPDGSEVTMCGNGSRCVALYCGKRIIKIETGAGILRAELKGKNIAKVRMTDPKDLKINLSITLKGKKYHVHHINTGVPHVIMFVDNIDNFDVKGMGREIRYHKAFRPKGANADFVKFINKRSLYIRTYERGVEDETLACGTGACASAIMASLLKSAISPVSVRTKSGEVLKIYFDKEKKSVKNVCLEGEAKKVYEGKIDY